MVSDVWSLFLDLYEPTGELLGNGAYASVQTYRNLENQTDYAVKVRLGILLYIHLASFIIGSCGIYISRNIRKANYDQMHYYIPCDDLHMKYSSLIVAYKKPAIKPPIEYYTNSDGDRRMQVENNTMYRHLVIFLSCTANCLHAVLPYT